MKKVLLLTAALSLLGGGAALAQAMQDLGGDGGVFGSLSTRSDQRRDPVINVYFEEGMGGQSKVLSNTIMKELEKSPFFDLVHTPTDATRIVAPTSVTVPASGKGSMKLAFQIAFPRGSDMDFTVSCDVGKPEVCAKAIRTRAERLYRDYINE